MVNTATRIWIGVLGAAFCAAYVGVAAGATPDGLTYHGKKLEGGIPSARADHRSGDGGPCGREQWGDDQALHLDAGNQD